jgi:hypothetical protein
MDKKTHKCSFSSITKGLDIFGVKMNFRINNKKEFRSTCGGLTSLLFIIAAAYFVIINFNYFITRSNVSLIFTNKIVDSNPKVNLTDVEFAFSFSLFFENNATDGFDSARDYVDVNLNLVQWVGESNFMTKNIQLKKCNSSDFYNVKPDLFQMNGIGKTMCPVISKDLNYTLAGLYTDYWYQYMEIIVSLKPNVTGEMVDKIENFLSLNPMMATFFFLDTGIDYESSSQPLPSLINSYYTSLNINKYKKTELLFSMIEFSSDENILISNPHYFYDTTLDKFSEYSYDVNNREITKSAFSRELVKFIIKASPKNYIVNRSYQKITDYLANMSGLISQVLFILMFTINFANRKFAENKIMSKVLKYKGKKDWDVKYLSEIFSKSYSERKRLSIRHGLLANIQSFEFNNSKSRHLKIHKNENIHQINPSIGRLEDIANMPLKDSKENSNSENLSKIEKLFIKQTEMSLNKENNHSLSDYKRKGRNLDDEDLHTPVRVFSNNKKNINNKTCSPDTIPKPTDHKRVLSDQIEMYEHTENVSPMLITHSKQMKTLDANNLNVKKALSKKTTMHHIDSSLKKREIDSDIHIERFFKLSTIEIFLIKAKCCCKKFKTRKKILKAGQHKMNFYLDVLTYIKKMQEIDILKYLLLSADQLCLFNFLSKPPVSSNDISSEIYKEFEMEQRKNLTLSKEEILQMHECYYNILKQDRLTNEEKKLVNLVDAEIDGIKM